MLYDSSQSLSIQIEVSRRSIGWGRKQIMDLRSSESHNDDWLGHPKCIKKYLDWNIETFIESHPIRQQFQSLYLDCSLLQQASFDRMDSEEQQNGVFLNQNSIDLRDRSSSIGSASSLQGSETLGMLPRDLSKDLFHTLI